MTKKQLLESLKDVDDEAEVRCAHEELGFDEEIVDVQKREDCDGDSFVVIYYS